MLHQSVHLGQCASRRCLLHSSLPVSPVEASKLRTAVRCLAAASHEVLPVIPRQAGISEGPWDRADVRAVNEALADEQESTSGRSPGSATGMHIFYIYAANTLMYTSWKLQKGAVYCTSRALERIRTVQASRCCLAEAFQNFKPWHRSMASQLTEGNSSMMASCTAQPGLKTSQMCAAISSRLELVLDVHQQPVSLMPSVLINLV